MNKYTLQLALILFVAVYSMQCHSTKQGSISSTYWRYTDEDLSYEFLLKSDGHIYSYHPNDASPENDFWKQHGKKIVLNMNDNYAIYKGKLINDSTMVGKAHSKGFHWIWTAKFVTNN